MTDQNLIRVIDTAWDSRSEWKDATVELKDAVETVIAGLDNGTLRVAEKIDGNWVTNQWIKKAVLLSFRLTPNTLMTAGPAAYYDKVPLKFSGASAEDFAAAGVRFVPVDTFDQVLPIARVGEGTMVDTWATVGSCAQVGAHCHLSGGAGIGGVLEPVQAGPTIIEDNCFIGARSEIVEGVIVEENSVISMGVFIGQSTKILDRATGEIYRGRVPAGSVVVPGSMPSKDGTHSLYCAVIVKRVDAKTRAKTSVNELLRD